MVHRFQGDTLSCHFGCGLIEGDRLEHYCVCLVISNLFRDAYPWLPGPSCSHPSLLFFILDPRLDNDHMIALAVLLHITRLAYETRRAGRRISGLATNWDHDVFGPTLALILCKDPGVGKYLAPPEVRVVRSGGNGRKRRRYSLCVCMSVFIV